MIGRRIVSLIGPFLTVVVLACALLALRLVASSAQPPSPVGTATNASQPGSPSVSVTISGTVTGPGGSPVADAWVGVGAHNVQQWQDTVTDASGFYSVTIETDGMLWLHVRPDRATRLTQVNMFVAGVSADLTQNFVVADGYLLDVWLTDGDGITLTTPANLDVQSLIGHLPDSQWYQLEWDDSTHHYYAVLPPDVYYVTATNPPDGFYDTTQAFDLRAADLAAGMSLNTSYVHPFPYDPPDAAKITIGPVDGLGEATVTGGPGAAMPLAHVLLVNLNSNHQVDAISDADGSFSASIYAPPGSAIVIKHGPASLRWAGLENGVSEGVNPFPGTIIYVPHTHSGDPGQVPFAAAGGIEIMVDDINETQNYVGAAWAITGTISPLVDAGEWTRVLTGTYDGAVVPGLYRGGFNWTHPALADLDDDGDLELLIGERTGRIVLYRNEGSATAPDWRFETGEYAGISTGDWTYPALADVTDDGAPDLFVGGGDGWVRVYYNTGTASDPLWPAEPDVSLEVGPMAAPALDDLNGDSDLDLLVGHVGGTLYYFENTGTLAEPVWTLQDTSYGGITTTEWLQPAFVNLDGDGDRDMLVGLCGQLIWLERGGTAQNPTWTRVESDPVGYGGGSCGTSPGVGDWNGTGGDDIVIGEHWGNLRFFRNDGPPAWTEQGIDFPFELLGDTAPALADWDGDDDLDLLLGQAHGELLRYVNEGSTADPDWRFDGAELTLPWTDHPHPYPAFADIDGDDDPDLFVGEGAWWPESGAGGNVRFYENVGTAAVPNWTLVVTDFLGLDVGGWSTPAFEDIDDDGDLDLFIGNEAGTLTFVENTGTSTVPVWAAPQEFYAGLELGGFSAPAFADVDQDNDLDLLVGWGSGDIALLRNTGTITSPAWALVATAHPAIYAGERAIPAAADIDNDGDRDLFVGDGDGGLNLFRYDGPGQPATGTFRPGDLLFFEGNIRLYSPAISETTDLGEIAVLGFPHLTKRYDEAGIPLPAENYFLSTMLSPTGFPIQRGGRASVGLEGGFLVEGFQYLGGHAIGGSFALGVIIPEDTPPGTYQPAIWLDFSSVPTSTEWLAANVTHYTFDPSEALAPPIQVEPAGGRAANLPARRLVWQLLMDDFVQGTRGATAREDQESFALASQIVSQGAPFFIPPLDVRTGQPITYRLEPFLPMISFTDRRLPGPPLVPFDLPGGQLHVVVREPDGTVRDLGQAAFSQSFNRTKTTRYGGDLNSGTVQIDDVYSLQTGSDQFRITFDQYGHHEISMTGVVSDVWGNTYEGGGTYDVWVAQPLDIDPGVLPGTPLAVADAFNPAIQFYPRVPAEVSLTVTLFPDSDPAQVTVRTLTGRANDYGTFSASEPFTLTAPGEIRVDLTAFYTDTEGVLTMGAMTWGGIVMTPDPQLVAHGRRGVDSLSNVPGNQWFFLCDLPIQAGAVSHTFNPYYNGDVVWSRMMDAPGECPAGISSGGDSLILGASVFDTRGDIEAVMRERAERMHLEGASPGTLEERFDSGEIPFFISTRSGQPPQLTLGQVGGPDHGDVDQIAYSYRSSQRPGVRVREVVAEDNQTGGYWRLDTLYDDQLGVGVLGDQPNDFKFQYVGMVYRDLDGGINEYLGQGTGWIFIPDSDPAGSRVMPPFAGYGSWPTDGGPLLTLQGTPIDIFILPTGTRPGAVLEQGDTFHFAGHIMPTLDSKVAYTVTAPSGARFFGGGQANSVGYFYNPDGDFAVAEPGLWSVDVLVWHDGQIGTGEQVDCATLAVPCPSGDVLGSESGRYWFYVVPPAADRLNVSTPSPGFLEFDGAVTPIVITGSLPILTGAEVDYTISMAGYILEHGQAEIDGFTYEIAFDPATLAQDFPNLDLTGRGDAARPGLSDTFAIGLLLRGQRSGQMVYRANTITIQGEQVFVMSGGGDVVERIYLPMTMRGG